MGSLSRYIKIFDSLFCLVSLSGSAVPHRHHLARQSPAMGSAASRRRPIRSIPLAQLRPLTEQNKEIRLISLQKGFGSEQIAEVSDRFRVVDLGSRLHDFMDTAAVMKNLDLVVTVDSSPAHLAGALGVPVWVALPRLRAGAGC